jgi:hypothetical protein
MTTLREAAQNVVEVWKLYGTTESLRGWMEILEAALAEPVQEPFCYHDGRNVVDAEFRHDSDVFPLFTAPPQRKPLTEEEIGIICASLGFAQISPVEVARAIERAHGIGGSSNE